MIRITSNNLENLEVSQIFQKFNASGNRVLRYYITITHKLLDLHKEVSAPELFILQDKVSILISSWDKKYDEYVEKQNLVAAKSTADELTLKSQQKLTSIGNILKHTISIDDKIDFEKYKDFSKYPDMRPLPIKPLLNFYVPEPEYKEPKISIFQKLLGKKTQIIELAISEHELSVKTWKEMKSLKEQQLQKNIKDWEEKVERQQSAYKILADDFYSQQKLENEKIDLLANTVATGEYQAVVEHASMVLEASNYSDLFEKNFEIEYHKEQKMLLVEYDLPEFEKMPKVKSVTFIKTTGEIKETFISEKEQNTNFDNTCFQICLRTIHELFEADEWNNIKEIAFNGFSNFTDKATGQEKRSLILSVIASKEDFQKIDLSKVDPKACFKMLKGVSASNLHSMTPIPPLIAIDKSDRRFVDAKETIKFIEPETNLASMNWEDFEHLIREIFEKEFNSRGGEVKITQASNDGGVDAIAFDPDPITGGKIVIQAKRYTNTVGVSAVRDLYGTVQHEGASKGILVTTSDFGADAHKFAADKPLTLLSGGNLLHLLEKHGHKAKIDIFEARKELGLTQK